jgi:signal peptidase II
MSVTKISEEKTENNTTENKKTTKGSWVWGIFIFALLIFIDQLTKALAAAYLKQTDVLPVIKGWIEIRIVYNRGISYGLGGSASPAVKIAVIIATAVMMLALAILYFKIDKNRSLLRTALVFVVAGGVGNLIDRVYYKVWEPNGLYGVRDMVDVSRLGFAVCNFADFFITAGAIMLVLSFLFFDKDAFFPVGKYKRMHDEAEAKEKAEQSGNAA